MSLSLQPEAFRDNKANLLVDYLHGFALAMECNPNRDELNLEMIEQPVTFICKTMALE